MYPRKSMLDYMTEMNRLFPMKNSENDDLLYPTTPNTSQHYFNQSSLARSSSSTDTSPESFPDMTTHRLPDTFQHQYESQRTRFDSHRLDQYDFNPHQYEYQTQDHRYETYMKPLEHEVPFLPPQIYETPLIVKHQRPIVGRRIMVGTENQMTKNFDNINMEWPENSLPPTPPKACTDQKFNQNVYYELFPAENKGIEFTTPVKTSPNSYITPPKMSNMSPRMTTCASMRNLSPRMTASPNTFMHQRMMATPPRMAEMSPRMTEMSPRMAEMSSSRKTSPGSSTSPHPLRFSAPLFKEPISGPSTSFRPNVGQSKMCTFCRKNGETPLVYMMHTVKEKVGNKNVVTCPILRSHVCTTCGASGDDAHTITYCPILRSHNNGQPLQSTTITLKNTRVKSNGRRRY